MKILFVSSIPLEYSSSANMRNIALLKGFKENGYEVYTLTPEPQKDFVAYDATICDIEIEKKYFIPMGKIHSAATVKKNKKAKLKNAIYKIVKNFKIYDFRSSLAKKEVKIEEHFDLMISSSDPKSSHLIAESLIKKNQKIAKKWIQYWGDPFADDINNKGIIPNFVIRNEERRILSLANIVLYVSPFTLEKQKKLYPACANKMIFLPIPYREKIFYNELKSEKKKFGYFGDYYTKNRNIIPLYNVFKKIKNEELIICGNSEIELEKKNNIKILERQSLENVRKMEQDVDILVCICNKKGTQIPGKIYHYSATNKPIMILIDGDYHEELKKYFESYDRFIICQNNEKDIRNTINLIKESEIDYSPVDKLCHKNIVKELLDESEKIKNEKNI